MSAESYKYAYLPGIKSYYAKEPSIL